MNRRSFQKRFSVWLGLGLGCLTFSLTAATNPAPSVGMEGRLEIALPGTLLEPKPVNERSPVILRVADTQPHGGLIRYDLRYIGLEPGQYNLGTNLVRKDGSTTADLPELIVSVSGRLPAQHSGLLETGPARALPRLGGYRTTLIVVGVAWVAALGMLAWSRRRPKPPVEAAPARAVTLSDRLRPLVEQAAQGNLPRDGQAQLERLLLTHWRRKLDLEALPMTDALARLKAHPESGQLLRELESWLHRPPGSVQVDVAALLAPYREEEVAA